MQYSKSDRVKAEKSVVPVPPYTWSHTSLQCLFWVYWHEIKWLSSPSHSAFYYRSNMLDHGECSHAWIKCVKLMRSLTSRARSLHFNQAYDGSSWACEWRPLFSLHTTTPPIIGQGGWQPFEHQQTTRTLSAWKKIWTTLWYTNESQSAQATNSKEYTTTIQMNKIDIIP